MADRPKQAEALESVLGLTFPPTTLSIDTPKAAGHRLAKAVVAKGNMPTRPVSLVDGLAVIARDVLVAPPRPGEDQAADAIPPPEVGAEAPPEDAPEVISGPLEPVADEGAPATEAEPMPDADGGEDAAGEAQESGTVRLTLRPFPPTNRLEDALISGQAIAVPAGGEVPRGGELVYPFSAFTAEVENATADLAAAHEEQKPPAEPEANGPENDENGDLPVAEPPRDWDLVGRFQQGEIELPRLSGNPHPNMVGIGAWARSREVLLPERAILRASDVALLTSLGIDEVKIYRRPVVGVASLGPVFPVAGRQNGDEAENAVCPLSSLVVYLARAARVAALPLGLAPMRFRKLAGLVEKWTKQVDILLLVGGSCHGPQCLGLDVLTALGKVQLCGLDRRAR